MTFAEAKTLLENSDRRELRDHAFGDREISWEKDGKVVAGGYAGERSSVWLEEGEAGFEGQEARELFQLGNLVEVSRNDETGEDAYQGH